MGSEMEISLVPIIIVVIVAILLCVLASCIKLVPGHRRLLLKDWAVISALGRLDCILRFQLSTR